MVSRKTFTKATVAASIGFVSIAAALRRLDHGRSRKSERVIPSLPDGLRVDGIFSQDGTRLHVDYYGDGDPTIFFVHGVTCNCTIWRYQKAYFKERYRVVSLDLRGHGRSAMPDSMDLHPDRLAEDLKAAVEAFEPKEFVIVAHSMGGMATIKFHEHFGNEYRGRLKGLVLIGTPGIDLVKAMAMGRVLGLFYPMPLEIVLRLLARENPVNKAFLALTKDSSATYLLARWATFGKKPPGDEVEFQREMSVSTPIPAMALGAKACLDYHAEYHLPNVDLPVLVLAGNKDTFTNRRAVQGTCELLPDARCKIYDGPGHNTLLECPEELNSDVEAFLKQCFRPGVME